VEEIESIQIASNNLGGGGTLEKKEKNR